MNIYLRIFLIRNNDINNIEPLENIFSGLNDLIEIYIDLRY